MIFSLFNFNDSVQQSTTSDEAKLAQNVILIETYWEHLCARKCIQQKLPYKLLILCCMHSLYLCSIFSDFSLFGPFIPSLTYTVLTEKRDRKSVSFSFRFLSFPVLFFTFLPAPTSFAFRWICIQFNCNVFFYYFFFCRSYSRSISFGFDCFSSWIILVFFSVVLHRG